MGRSIFAGCDKKLPDDLKVLRQGCDALKLGGHLFVTAPAFPRFWSYKDEMSYHFRRYRRADFVRLSRESGLTLFDSRYFMFFLSSVYWFGRIKPSFATMSSAQKNELISKQHEVPAPVIDGVLSFVFAAETPLGHHVRFPWRTSFLAVLKK